MKRDHPAQKTAQAGPPPSEEAEAAAAARAARLEENLRRLDELSQRLVKALARREYHDPGLEAPGPDLVTRTWAALMTNIFANPARLMEHQVSYWSRTLRLFAEAQKAMATGGAEPPAQVVPDDDRRFPGKLWDEHPFFNLVKQQYLINAQAVDDALKDLEGLDPLEKRRIAFFTRQIVELLSPANFLATNPEALRRAVETDGESLVRGLENLVRDIERNRGELLVTLADPDAFRVGVNLGTTPGEVVFRNRMFELIQYHPTTEEVHATPLVIFPPWINKFYILDLRPEKSLVKWLVDRGFTVFVVSWVNPDASYADVGLDTYVEEGFLTAIEKVRELTGEARVNATGYCVGGTVLALTCALLSRRKDPSIRAATFFTTLTDFTDPGEMSVFISEDFISGIEREVALKGCLSSFFMARTFSFLRPNDLVYQPAIRSYMMGERPPAFDLLYWNGDGTNLPGRFVVEYLRQLCQQNLFAKGELELLGERIGTRDIRQTAFQVGCESDHIAAWRACMRGFATFGSRSRDFILSQAGHVAGIVNPPSRNKYGHWTGDRRFADPDAWLRNATFHEGSWWPRWGEWLARRSGRKVPAREPRHSLGPAPGTYVLKRAEGC